jgi:hypothetical protein
VKKFFNLIKEDLLQDLIITYIVVSVSSIIAHRTIGQTIVHVVILFIYFRLFKIVVYLVVEVCLLIRRKIKERKRRKGRR